MTTSTSEDAIRRLLDAGEYRAAGALAVEAYGSEVLGFLTALLRDEASADEVFSKPARTYGPAFHDSMACRRSAPGFTR